MNNKKHKFIIALIIAAAAIFAVYNVVWLVFAHAKYYNYQKAVGYDEELKRYYYRDQDDYVFSVRHPNYLSFSGNLSITPVITGEDSAAAQDIRVHLTIWPSAFGDDYEFNVTIQLPDKDNAESETKYNSYNFTLDGDQKPINSLSSEEQEVLESNRASIDLIYKKARDMWGIPKSEQGASK